ncbi:MAG: hypothetical protein CMJ58_12810 [Planctomycetaceae bacterium]|nr:hypothetical protein [Planctomycetaceae bacterium]
MLCPPERWAFFAYQNLSKVLSIRYASLSVARPSAWTSDPSWWIAMPAAHRMRALVLIASLFTVAIEQALQFQRVPHQRLYCGRVGTQDISRRAVGSDVGQGQRRAHQGGRCRAIDGDRYLHLNRANDRLSSAAGQQRQAEQPALHCEFHSRFISRLSSGSFLASSALLPAQLTAGPLCKQLLHM